MNNIFVMGLVLILLCVPESYAKTQANEGWFSLMNTKGRAIHSSLVTVDRDNVAHVHVYEHDGTYVPGVYPLTDREVNHLKGLIQESGVITETPEFVPEDVSCRHGGVIQVNYIPEDHLWMGSACYGDKYQELTEFVWLLFNQARILNQFEKGEGLYDVYGAVSPTSAATKVLQPKLFLEPVLSRINDYEEFQDLSWSFQILSWLMEPNEFADLIQNYFKMLDHSQYSLWMETIVHHNCYSGLAPEVKMALLSVFLKELQSHFRPPANYGQPNGDSYSRMLDILAKERYVEAIPYLVEIIGEHKQPYAQTHHMILPRMGEPALDEIAKFLDSSNRAKKILAVQMLVISARMNPKAGYSYPLPAEDFQKVKQRLKEEFLPKLMSLSKTKNDQVLKSEVDKAIEDITLEMEK